MVIGRSCTSVLVVPQRKMAFVGALLKKRPWPDLRARWSATVSSPGREKMEKERGRVHDCPWRRWKGGCHGGAASRGGSVAAMRFSSVGGCRSSCVEKKRRRREIKEKEEGEGKKEKEKKKMENFQNLKISVDKKVNLWSWCKN
jgi:hypothetical protein